MAKYTVLDIFGTFCCSTEDQAEAEEKAKAINGLYVREPTPFEVFYHGYEQPAKHLRRHDYTITSPQPFSTEDVDKYDSRFVFGGLGSFRVTEPTRFDNVWKARVTVEVCSS